MKTKAILGRMLFLSPLLVPFGARAQESSNLPDEYLKNLKNYEFVNTQGMKELAPNRHPWMHSEHEDPDTWELPTEEEIERLAELGIAFPDFSFIQGTDTVAPGQKRQRTHTVEHILYALPGDALSLYPYYGLEETVTRYSDHTDRYPTKNYLETFSHWYDYRNGGRVLHHGKDGKTYDLLDFPADRNLMQISDHYGFYGGVYMSPGTQDAMFQPGTLTVYEVYTPEEYINTVNTINNAGGMGRIEIMADLDFSSYNDKEVPMLGENWATNRFRGVINGNGHEISNLKIARDQSEVGLIRYSDEGATVCNLVVASSCLFQGTYNIGLIAKFEGGGLTVRNVTMNATVKGTRADDDHCTGAILGNCSNNNTDNYLIFENIYVGGEIGNPDMGRKNNTVLCGWLATDNTHSNTIFKNILFKGHLYGDEDLPLAKYIRRVTHEKFNAADCYKSGNTWVEKHTDYSIFYTNCYGDAATADPAWKNLSAYTSMKGWTDPLTPPTTDMPNPLPANNGAVLLDNSGHRPWHENNDEEKRRRIAGTSAVFYFPDNDNLGDEWMTDTKEYVIASDFSQTFEPLSHLDIGDMEITEPVVAFRHIFRIRDGREQARRLYEENREYIRQHQHKVSARANANFQIRLDFPLPTNWGTSGGVTNYYYQKQDGSYGRVKQFTLRVLDGETRKATTDPGFNCGADIRMRRAGASGDHTHAVALNGPSDGKYDYHTMLHIDKSKIKDNSHYIVQIVAKDDDGNILQTKDNGDMVIMEYDITFLPEKGASLLTEADLYEKKEYAHARDAYMKEHYGEPIDVIDFDAYIKLNKLPDDDPLKRKTVSYSVIEHKNDTDWTHKDFPVWSKNSDYQGNGKTYHSFYKWPIAWNRSTYSFGYNYRYDYNMYMLATHSENVPYHARANDWNGIKLSDTEWVVDENGTANIKGDGYGLYDRLYYKTKRLHDADPRVNVEQGYFYYVNGASDPGVSARLNFSIPCPGSRVIVSAWVAEMSPASSSQDEPANLSFNFVAVMNGSGERITLHNFITGYLGEKSIYGERKLEKPEQLGQWLNVYYSFVPRLAEFYSDTMTFDDVDHFELELAHNGMSSAGSDYAIDDIRAYVVPPYSDAAHEGYACDDSALDVTIDTAFETLLEKSGETEVFEGETADKMSLYFAFVDKEMLDEGADPEKAFVKGIRQGEDTLPYGTVEFSNNYRSNDRWLDALADGNIEKGKAYRLSADNGDRMIKFRSTLTQGALHAGKEYYVVFRAALADTDTPEEGSLNEFFDVKGQCGYSCIMRVRHSLKIKLDGVLRQEDEELTVCENQSPVIQLNVWSTDDEPVEVVKNAYFDWFDGSINDFANYRFKDYPSSMETLENEYEDDGALTLKHALEVFRFRYSEAESVVGIKAENAAGEDGEILEQWMLDIIGIASAPDASGRTRLLLHQASFVMPPVNLPDDGSKGMAKVVAIPIIDLYPEGSYSVCSSPTEVGVTIGNRTPILRHGLTGITYPEHMADVPLRVGLGQLGKDGVTSLSFTKRRLDMPVRVASSSDGVERDFTLVKTPVGTNGVEPVCCLLLVQSDDPEYRDLGTLDEEGNETNSLLWVGEIGELVAKGSDGSETLRRHYTVNFDESFRFKEGYFYRMRFSFEEKSDDIIDADEEVVCSGQDVFTLKIVPEYMLWTADADLSWDNDANWCRVSSGDVLKDEWPEGSPFFTDGASGNRRGFAPLPFTKVIVAAPSTDETGVVVGETPWLYMPASSGSVRDEYFAEKSHFWTSVPSCAEVSEEMHRVGAPTPLIQYDMTGYVTGVADGGDLLCRPWTANNCSEIHFLPGATIMNQQALNYERAWVDVELQHSRWYLLSTPLKDVYAGDFYLPTANGRQETELFQEISFDESLNNRFAPAVYQRGWDKGEAHVYEFGKTGARNAAVKTFWSHVYNDVAEVYGGGNAFSIKTDVSKVTDAPDKVLFRLPKADEEYLYYKSDGLQTGHATKLGKKNTGRLNDVKGTLRSTTANAGRYFLIGNPFMTHFDIRKFLEKNSAKLEQRYWLVTEQGMVAGSVTEEGVVAAPLTDAPVDPSVLAPMQGFFVEARTPATFIDLDYDKDMMRRYDSGGGVLTETTRSESNLLSLRITSINAGQPSSAALLMCRGGSDESGVDAFDFRDLGIPSTVFFAREGRARSIAFCADVEGMEIGVIADEDTETTLMIEDARYFGDLMLLDRENGTVTPLDEVGEINVKGPVSGRLYIVSALGDGPAFDSLLWSFDGHMLTVSDAASTGYLSVQVYDTLGRVLADKTVESDSLTIPLGKGVSVVRMTNASEKKTIKLNI